MPMPDKAFGHQPWPGTSRTSLNKDCSTHQHTTHLEYTNVDEDSHHTYANNSESGKTESNEPQSNCQKVSKYELMLKKLLEKHELWSFLSLMKSPMDGHCLIHSVVSSYNLQRPDREQITHESVLFGLINETKGHVDAYKPFLEENSNKTLLNGLDQYVNAKNYDTSFGDILPNILANVLSCEIIIIEKLGYEFTTHAIFSPR